jgi:iron uptake system EfeUOB component EfeO/EfeM
VSAPALARSPKALAAAALAAVFGVLILGAVVGVGGSGGDGQSHSITTPRPPTPLQRYSEQSAVRAGVGGAGGAPPAPDLAPLPVTAFNAPFARSRAYDAAQLAVLVPELGALRSALATLNRPAAETAWKTAWARYLRLGGVYGAFGSLDRSIDGSPGGLPGGIHDPDFTGFHRIEMGLWTGAPLHPLLRWEARLSVDVARLRRIVPTLALDPLDYSARAHEILEDAQRDLLSGTDVPWSGAGVLGTAAGLDATEEVLGTLRPLLDGREDSIEEVDAWLVRLRATLDSIRRAHGGRWPSNTELTQTQTERLDGVLGGALEALGQIPGTLETKLPSPPPPLSRHPS